MDDYEPIDCSLHDRYEAAAVRRELVRVTWADGEHTGLITNIEVTDGAEYLVLDQSVRVRLDNITGFSRAEAPRTPRPPSATS